MYLQRHAGLPLSVLDGFRSDFSTVEQDCAKAASLLEETTNALMDAFDHALHQLPESGERTLVYNGRKAFFQKKKLVDLPQNIENQYFRNKRESYLIALDYWHAAQHMRSEAYEQAVQQSYTYLQTWAADERLLRPLTYSSHTLLQALPSFRTKRVDEFAKQERHTAMSLLEYVTRMATKTTPLSRFATVSWVSDLPEEPEFPWETGSGTETVVKVTPNVALLPALYDVLLEEPIFARSLSVRLNPSLLLNEHQYKWWYYDGQTEALQSSDVTLVLSWLSEQLEDDVYMPITQLTAALSEITAAELKDAELYLKNCIDTGFLEWVFPETGQTTSWCGKLYQYLGFIEGGSSCPVIVEAAFLLQWLRSAARTLPFQSIEQAIQTQQEALKEVKAYFLRYKHEVPTLSPEQLFYEDVLVQHPAPCPLAEIKAFNQALRQELETVQMPGLSQRRAHLGAVIASGEGAKKTVLEAFEDWNLPDKKAIKRLRDTMPEYPIVATWMPFQDENGKWCAVLNSLQPDNGKWQGRWLQLLPNEAREHLMRQWWSVIDLFNLNWYAAFNANQYLPLLSRKLNMPGGFPDVPIVHLKLKDINIELDEHGRPVLMDVRSQKRVFIHDPGLEGMSTRPLMIQILLMAGTSGINRLWLPQSEPLKMEHNKYYPRKTTGSLVLHRAFWNFDSQFWDEYKTCTPQEFFFKFRAWAEVNGLPSRLFMEDLHDGKGQYIDLDSPLHVQILQKEMGTISLEEAIFGQEWAAAIG